MAIVMRNDEIIASIHFENERLIVRAITQEDADRILKIIAVPYSHGVSRIVIMDGEEVTLFGSKIAEPETSEHFMYIGSGAGTTRLFSKPDELISSWRAKDIIPPTFEFQAEYHLQSNND